MKSTAPSTSEKTPTDELEDLGFLLKEIEREETPERLLELARKLQAALNERRKQKHTS